MRLNKKVSIFGICIILTAIVVFYASILFKTPNYKKCDRSILLYYKEQSFHIKVSTPTERKCSQNFFLAMKLRSFFLNDSNASYYLYKMSTKFNSDKYYWLYISAKQGNIKAKDKLLNLDLKDD